MNTIKAGGENNTPALSASIAPPGSITGKIVTLDGGLQRLDFPQIAEAGDYDLVVRLKDGTTTKISPVSIVSAVESASDIVLTSLSLVAPKPGSSADTIVEGHPLTNGMELEFSNPGVTAEPLKLDATGMAHTKVYLSPLAMPGSVAARLRIPSENESPWLSGALIIPQPEAIPPQVQHLIPNGADQGAMLDLVIYGQNFADGFDVALGTGVTVDDFLLDVGLTISNPVRISPTILIVTVTVTEAATLGPHIARVTNNDSSHLADVGGAFEVHAAPAPILLEALEPSQATPGVPAAMIVKGHNLEPGMVLDFSNPSVTALPLEPGLDEELHTTIMVWAQAWPGKVSVRARMPGGSETDWLSDAFTIEAIVPKPEISRMRPDEAAQGEKLTVSIYGQHLDAATSVQFGTLGAGDVFKGDNTARVVSIDVVSSTVLDITLDLSDAPTQTYAVLITSGGGRPDVQRGDVFTVTPEEVAEPILPFIFPSAGSPGTTERYLVMGENLAQDVAVAFLPPDEGQRLLDHADPQSVKHDGSLKILNKIWHHFGALEIELEITDDAEPGPRTLLLSSTTSAGTHVYHDAFTVEEAEEGAEDPIDITGVDPNHIGPNETADLTISGSGFDDLLTVEFGNIVEGQFHRDDAITVEPVSCEDEVLVVKVTTVNAMPGPRILRLFGTADKREALTHDLFSIDEEEEEGDLHFEAIEPNNSDGHDTLLVKVSGAGFTEKLTIEVGRGDTKESFKADEIIKVPQRIVCAADHTVALLELADATPGQYTILLRDEGTGDVDLGVNVFTVSSGGTSPVEPSPSGSTV